MCAFLLATITFVNAQQTPQNGQRRMMASAEDRVKLLDEKLKLTDDQKVKATAIYSALNDEMKNGNETDKNLSREERMSKMQKMTTDTNDKLAALLTDDQKKVFKTYLDEIKAAQEKRMKERQAGGGGR